MIRNDCIMKCFVWKGDGEGEVGEACYVGDAADMMDDYQQSGDESDLEQDVANEDYIVEEPDDFDVTLPYISLCPYVIPVQVQLKSVPQN